MIHIGKRRLAFSFMTRPLYCTEKRLGYPSVEILSSVVIRTYYLTHLQFFVGELTCVLKNNPCCLRQILRSSCQQDCCCFAFGRSCYRFSTGTQAIMSDIFHYFSHPLRGRFWNMTLKYFAMNFFSTSLLFVPS